MTQSQPMSRATRSMPVVLRIKRISDTGVRQKRDDSVASRPAGHRRLILGASLPLIVLAAYIAWQITAAQPEMITLDGPVAVGSDHLVTTPAIMSEHGPEPTEAQGPMDQIAEAEVDGPAPGRRPPSEYAQDLEAVEAFPYLIGRRGDGVSEPSRVKIKDVFPVRAGTARRRDRYRTDH